MCKKEGPAATVSRITVLVLLFTLVVMAPACKKGTPARPPQVKETPVKAPPKPQGLYEGQVKIGHVVGVCMSCMFFAHLQKYFPSEGINSKPVWTPHPSDAITMLDTGEEDQSDSNS